MIAIKAENISKQYRLGLVGTGTLSHDLNRWWARVRGQEDPYLQIGETNDRTAKGDSEYVWSLRDVSFEIEQGQAVGIIGRNGAGKSTLLKILSRITAPTQGVIKTKGRIASLLEVGTGFHPELTGRENIFLNGAILGMRKTEIQRKFDEIVDFSGVERYIDTPVKRYSSGMYVRLAFGVAAHLESETLIIDEVLAVGDAEFQKKCLGKMSEISKSDGRTILFVSHNITAVKSLCTKAIMLENGCLAHSGNANDVIALYTKGELENANNFRQFKEGEVGIKNFSLRSIGIQPKGKNFDAPICRDDEMEIVIEYNYEEKIADRLDFTLRFKDEAGNYIFNTTSANLSTPIIQLGNNKVIVNIPNFFLNPHSFLIDILVVKNQSTVLLVENMILNFSVNPEKINIGNWMGKGAVPITLKLEWH
jgi:lipopolysaccharide transport system ATP-binding protein